MQPGFLFVERRTQNNRTKERGRQAGSVAGEQRPKEKHLGKSVDKANVTRTCSVCAACNASMPTFVANLDICGDMSLALMTHLLIVPVEGLYNRFQKSQPATLQNSPNSQKYWPVFFSSKTADSENYSMFFSSCCCCKVHA